MKWLDFVVWPELEFKVVMQFQVRGPENQRGRVILELFPSL
jgi:hypothetical protein